MQPFLRSGLALLICWVLTVSIAAPSPVTATLRGQVTRHGGAPVPDVIVTLIETKQATLSDADGNFVFEAVPLGHYHLKADGRGRGSAVLELSVVVGDNIVALELSTSQHQETIIVTATRSGAGSDEVVQPANVLDSMAITEKMQPTLGELLGQEVGVSQTFFGAGASRPIIRGLAGGRVRMLEHGLGTGDVSDTSPDHAVSIDPTLAEQIEVLRGASTLLYGSSAVGGVVNVIDRRVPEALTANPMTSTLNFRLGSVAGEQMGSADLNGHVGNVAWHADAAVRETDDYETPTGSLPNSDLETQKFTGGVSYIWDGKGFVGASYTRFNTKYGVPGEEADPAAGGPRIDIEQNKVDLRGGFDAKFGPFDGANFSFAGADYRHEELEDGELASLFQSDYLESRVELHNGEGGKLRGTVGLQYIDRDTDVSGAEAFLPPNRLENVALFALERLRTGKLNWELGLRFESQENRTDDPLLDRDFDGVSGNFGLLYRFGNGWGVGGSVTRSERLPSNEELYSDGAHLATRSFEVGDPNLIEETARGAEVILRKTAGTVFTGSLSTFYTRFDDFIYLEQQFDANGDPLEIDGLPLFFNRQADSEFYGYELELLFPLFHGGSNDLDLVVRSDRTVAELLESGEALPRIPPQRYTLGLDYRGHRWSATAEAVYRDEVTGNDVAPSATPTSSSTVVNASVSRRFIGRDVVHVLMLRGTNLTNEDVRLNTSRLKDTVPLPGRDISVIYRLQF